MNCLCNLFRNDSCCWIIVVVLVLLLLCNNCEEDHEPRCGCENPTRCCG